jgi:hypothetical protein
MARGKVKVLRANGQVILETILTDRLRIQIPENLRPMFTLPQRIKVTIDRVGEQKQNVA